MLACARLSVSVGERKKQASSEIASERKRVGREKGESVSFFCSTSLCPQSRPLPEKPFLLLKCQNIKSCCVGGFPVLNMFVRLCVPEAK